MCFLFGPSNPFSQFSHSVMSNSVTPWTEACQASLSIKTHFKFKANIGLYGLPAGSDSKESVCNAGDLGSIPGSGRSPGEVDGYPLHFSCLENSMDRET